MGKREEGRKQSWTRIRLLVGALGLEPDYSGAEGLAVGITCWTRGLALGWGVSGVVVVVVAEGQKGSDRESTRVITILKFQT